jgi:hypothetical protein
MMAKEKRIKTNGSRFVKLYYNPDCSPVKRSEPKERMSKKERLRRRRENHPKEL